MICSFVPDDCDSRARCRDEATSLVDGAPRCGEHTPTIEPLTEARGAEFELDALIFDVAHARPVNGPRPRFRRAPVDGWFDDPDYYGDEADFW